MSITTNGPLLTNENTKYKMLPTNEVVSELLTILCGKTAKKRKVDIVDIVVRCQDDV